MAERVYKDWRDHVTVNPEESELERQDEALFASAKSGSLFEPDMTPKEWRQFCRAARIEEEERKAKVPKRHSQLSKKQRELLDKGSGSIKNAGVRKLIEKREELIKRLRPQCVDANDAEFEKALLEELGMTEDEFKRVDKSLGLSEQAWQELEKLNDVEDDTISG
jgi:hypothetical protein